jgi:hypothetical protein
MACNGKRGSAGVGNIYRNSGTHNMGSRGRVAPKTPSHSTNRAALYLQISRIQPLLLMLIAIDLNGY